MMINNPAPVEGRRPAALFTCGRRAFRCPLMEHGTRVPQALGARQHGSAANVPAAARRGSRAHTSVRVFHPLHRASGPPFGPCRHRVTQNACTAPGRTPSVSSRPLWPAPGGRSRLPLLRTVPADGLACVVFRARLPSLGSVFPRAARVEPGVSTCAF